MSREAISTQSANFSLLQLALPSRSIRNIGIFLLDPASDRLYMKLRSDWSGIAGPEDIEVLECLGEDLQAKAEEAGGEAFLKGLADSLSNSLLITEPENVMVFGFQKALDRLFEEHVQRTEVLPFVTHVPLFSLRAAATKFSQETEAGFESEGWVRAPAYPKLHRNMFAARVVGRSMEPLIPDGSLCLFRGDVVGSRQGKRLLIQRFGVTDSSAEFTVKVYTSRKGTGEGRQGNIAIVLTPLNREFEAMEFGPEDEHRRFRVIAEFVQVLEEPA